MQFPPIELFIAETKTCLQKCSNIMDTVTRDQKLRHAFNTQCCSRRVQKLFDVSVCMCVCVYSVQWEQWPNYIVSANPIASILYVVRPSARIVVMPTDSIPLDSVPSLPGTRSPHNAQLAARFELINDVTSGLSTADDQWTLVDNLEMHNKTSFEFCENQS